MWYRKKKLYALGRLKSGEMNRTERAYANLLEARKRAGEIVDYRFESVKLKIADGACWYLPDFLVILPSGEIQLHEVKGSKAIFAEDARVKCKVCAERYPFRLFICYPLPKKKGGGWSIEEYPSA